jgi:hypothetical protein
VGCATAAVMPSSRRCMRSTCSSSAFCCSSILRSSSRTAAFSAFKLSTSLFRSLGRGSSAATLFSGLAGCGSGAVASELLDRGPCAGATSFRWLSGPAPRDCAKARPSSNVSDVHISATTSLMRAGCLGITNLRQHECPLSARRGSRKWQAEGRRATRLSPRPAAAYGTTPRRRTRRTATKPDQTAWGGSSAAPPPPLSRASRTPRGRLRTSPCTSSSSPSR